MALNVAGLPMSRKQLSSAYLAQSVPQIALWTGAVAAGKTVASLLAWLIAVGNAPETGLIMMVGQTLQTIERNLIEPLQDERLFGGLSAQVQHTPGSNTVVILGRTVHLVGAFDSRSERRIRGATVALAYIDEATLVPQAFWVMMLSRLRVPGAKLFATTNPGSQSHWLRKDFILRAAAVGMRHWHFTLDDNPYLEDEFVERLKAQYTGLFYKRFIEGLWIAAEGAIYDMWDESRHVVDIMPPISQWIGVGIDHGTTAPFAALLLGLGVNRKLYLASEWRYESRQARKQLTDTEYSRRVREWLQQVPIPATQIRGVRPQYMIVDPAAAGFRTQLAADGMNPVLANNAVLDGIRVVSSLLALGNLMVHRSCTGWINEVSSYAWDEKAAEVGEDKPMKVDDHSLDAGRYVTFTTKSVWGSVIPLTMPASPDPWPQAV